MKLKKENQVIYRQGDVLIMQVSTGSKKVGKEIERDKDRVVLEYGELTGHAHAIMECEVTFAWVEGELDRLLRVKEPATVRHEEHAEIRLPVGEYIVRRQREYSPEEIRFVAD